MSWGRYLPAGVVVVAVVLFAVGPTLLGTTQGVATPPPLSVEGLATRVAALETQVAVLQTRLGTPAMIPGSAASPIASPFAGATPSAGALGPSAVVGNGLDLLPPARAGEIAVVAVGRPIGFLVEVPFLVRNGTGQTVARVEVAVTAYAADGTLLATERATSVNPFLLPPDGIAFGAATFLGVSGLPADARFEAVVAEFANPDDPSLHATVRYADVEIVQHTVFPDRVTGMVRNTSGFSMTVGGVDGVCLAADGAPLATFEGQATVLPLAPGAESPFQADLPRDVPCDRFLLSATLLD